jgi:uncharacterized phage protein gp47/JayE
LVDYGVTSEGFKRKSREEIKEDMGRIAQYLFGNDINLNQDGPFGKIINLVSLKYANKWRELENVYNSHYVQTASNAQLDEVCQYIGISRQEPSKAVGQITIYGDEGAIISPGFNVETNEPNPKVFETINSDDEQIGSSGELTLEIRAVEAGKESNVASGEITEVTNPISGVDSVLNNTGTAGGRNLESDSELRQRYIESIDKPGGATVNSIRATVLDETDAIACLVMENTDFETDADGLPPKSFETVVLGGQDSNVAESIFSVKPAGIQAYGDEGPFTVYDDVGLQKQIAFSRATRVDIYLDITLYITNAFDSSDGQSNIEENILNYINNLQIGNNVRFTRIISEVHKEDGVIDTDVLLGDTEGDLSENVNITIGFREVARIDSVNISFSEVVS